MMKLGQELRNSRTTIRILILIGALMFTLSTCKSPMSPEEGEADIIVNNEYGETLDIYMNGNFKFSIGYKSSIEIDNVSFGEHELEAKEINTGIVIDSETIDVDDYTDYTWTIDDPPDINVINEYGPTLKIYMDDIYQFDLVDEEDRWIIDVSFGERFLKAIKASDGKEVASITIDVEEKKDYTWTIE